jgi:dolichyl-phosphate beta-glucosyltransferase
MSSNQHHKYVYLSVVIPAYNESERIGPTLASVAQYLARQPFTSEVVVVDDGSHDAMADVVDAYAERYPDITLVRHLENHGKGWAVRTGMLNAHGEYRLFMDADGSTSIEHWRAVESELQSGSDIVIGSRHVEGSDIVIHQSVHRETLGFAFRHVVQTLFRLGISDTQNGFKAFTRAAAERIFSRQSVKGWAFDVEILSIARALGYRASEIPVRWLDDERSRMKFLAMPRMLLDLIALRASAIPRPVFSAELPQLATN